MATDSSTRVAPATPPLPTTACMPPEELAHGTAPEAEGQGVRVVVPRGSLLGEEVGALRRRLGEALIAEANHVVVDLRAVRYVSARALGVLVSHLGELRRRGGDLKVLGCRPPVRQLFELCGLGTQFEFLAAEDDTGSGTWHVASEPESLAARRE